MNYDSLNMSENQYELVKMCVDAWQLGIFWGLMYMQSRLFDADNAKSMEEELGVMPKYYDEILQLYYGKSIGSMIGEQIEPLYNFFIEYLKLVAARKRAQAAELKQQWLIAMEKAAHRLADLNPYWSANVWETTLTHMVQLLSNAIDSNIMGQYKKIGDIYLVLDRLATELGAYMGIGIIRQFNIP